MASPSEKSPPEIHDTATAVDTDTQLFSVDDDDSGDFDWRRLVDADAPLPFSVAGLELVDGASFDWKRLSPETTMRTKVAIFPTVLERSLG